MFYNLLILYALASAMGMIARKSMGSKGLFYVISTLSYLLSFAASVYSAVFLYVVGYSGTLLDMLCVASVVAGFSQLIGLLLLLNPNLRRINNGLMSGGVDPTQVHIGLRMALPVLFVTVVTTLSSLAIFIIFAIHYF